MVLHERLEAGCERRLIPGGKGDADPFPLTALGLMNSQPGHKVVALQAHAERVDLSLTDWIPLLAKPRGAADDTEETGRVAEKLDTSAALSPASIA